MVEMFAARLIMPLHYPVPRRGDTLAALQQHQPCREEALQSWRSS
jgi:hypothetical protein